MIAYSPAHVFESMGAREQALFDAASPLMVRFEKICACIRASRSRSFQAVPKELTADFPTMLFEYVQPSVLEGLKRGAALHATPQQTPIAPRYTHCYAPSCVQRLPCSYLHESRALRRRRRRQATPRRQQHSIANTNQ